MWMIPPHPPKVKQRHVKGTKQERVSGVDVVLKQLPRNWRIRCWSGWTVRVKRQSRLG